MKIVRTSPFSGEINVKDLDVTEEQMHRFYNKETDIQTIFPHLSKDDREFILSGITSEEWAKYCPEIE